MKYLITRPARSRIFISPLFHRKEGLDTRHLRQKPPAAGPNYFLQHIRGWDNLVRKQSKAISIENTVLPRALYTLSNVKIEELFFARIAQPELVFVQEPFRAEGLVHPFGGYNVFGDVHRAVPFDCSSELLCD